MYEGEIFLIIKMLEVLQFVHQTIIGRQKRKLEDKKLKDLIFLYFRMILIGVKRN